MLSGYRPDIQTLLYAMNHDSFLCSVNWCIKYLCSVLDFVHNAQLCSVFDFVHKALLCFVLDFVHKTLLCSVLDFVHNAQMCFFSF